MLPAGATIVPETDVANYAWSSLRVFRNIEHTSAAIMSAHDVPIKHVENVRKQARQIRHCLIQAEEYAKAAEAVTSATRPTLQYYSIMCLATAEILFKGSGDLSLDIARQQHDHHGLSLHVAATGRKAVLASQLSARPAVFGGGSRRGTFELWHSVSRPNPLCGPLVHTLPNGGAVTYERAILLRSPDDRPSQIPDQGFDLLTCMRHIPGLGAHLRNFGVSPLSARCNLRAQRTDKLDVTSILFHPEEESLLGEIYGRIKSDPPDASTYVEYPSGRNYSLTVNQESPARHSVPNGVSIGEHTYLWPYDDEECRLNYFGWLYIVSFILGNYARYYPDKWMSDIEEAAYLAGAADAFYRIAANHAPLSTLSELSRLYAVPPR